MTNGEAPQAPAGPQGPAAPQAGVGGSGLLWGVKIFAIVSGVLALIMIQLMTMGRIESEEEAFGGLSVDVVVTLGLVMGVVGLVFGVIGIFIGPRRMVASKVVPPLNSLMLGIGTLCLLMGGMLAVWNDTRYAEVTNLGIESFLYIILYGWFVLWFVELGSTSMRYAVVDDYIRQHGIQDFSLSPVLGMYFIWFIVLMFAILGWSIMIIWATPSFIVEMTRTYGYEALADSVMFNSVYSVAISMAIWFTITGLILTLVYSFVKDTKTEVIEVRKDEYQY